ncbi:uncharacterized protein LOC134214794 [Armigeres subalbatus]|uniref:uncharacterized protein LOC134214794 n=1 Tax=Armigeres subalbatus TaxID=124917 RepID=UPI002ED5A395
MNIVDILDYVGESVRPIKEGYAVFAANHIVCIGYRNVQRSDMLTEVVGYVTQTSHPGCSPHEVLLLVGPDISRWILKCSCKAGTAKCKHIIACLLFIEKNRLLEYISCTDVTQAWGISKAGRKATWGAKRVTDLCCVNKPKLLETPESNAELELLTTSFNRILNVSKNSSIYKHIQGRHMNEPKTFPNRAIQSSRGTDNSTPYIDAKELITCLEKPSSIVVQTMPIEIKEYREYFEKAIKVNIEKCVEIAIETQDQNTNSWRIFRSKRITASSAYKLFTYLNNKRPDWDRKISQYWDSKTLKVAATKYGKEAEPFAFNCYRKYNPNIKKCGLVIHPTECWMAGSPDGVDPISNIVLEIKCPMNKDASLTDIMNSNAIKLYIKNALFQKNCY